MGGADLVHEGQLHPWFNDLETDGTIQTLINESCNNCVCLLYKAKVLPPNIGVGIIQEIMREIIVAPYYNSLDISFKALCSLVESIEHQIITM
ncbi:MAG: hypothetical protein EZS28_014500 [Streblomastix strix]|uniref:Uncharacterized protein n=1 Tax=Streblomastix strix TaxID=222440 RepID=A0A5J4W4S0_9EUKA|nr:MAG: hypothetical protein EZS28_014500 [Streblomastix strix]